VRHRTETARLDRVFVLGDEAQLSRVVSNLVDNALRYAASSVELSVRDDRGDAVIRVTRAATPSMVRVRYPVAASSPRTAS
jgi:signal transduction histidine kinase